MSKTTVVYKDIAPGAAEDASVSVSGGSGNTSQIPFGITPGKFVTLEPSRWLLDGMYDNIYDNTKTGFWSTEVSGADGRFESTPVITLEFDERYTSTGISIVFDEATGEYCCECEIIWYRDGSLQMARSFQPDEVQYFCECQVKAYDKIEIRLKKTVVPYRRARVNKILLGIERTFEMDEILNGSIVNQGNESAIELPISTFTWTLNSKNPVNYLFQIKQPIEVWNNGIRLGTYYIDSSSRTSSRGYSIECHDALGVLEHVPFKGGAYLDGISAKSLLIELAKPFEVAVDESVEDVTLYGVILEGTKRSAIQQIVFAWGTMLSTDGGDTLRVFNQPSVPTTIPRSRTFLGGSVDTSPVVTSVNVVAHTYTEDEKGTVKIGDKKYVDTQETFTVLNPSTTVSDRDNAKEITSATLVSPEIGKDVANRVYKYYMLRETTRQKLLFGGEKIGDCIATYTPWGEIVVGNLHKMEIKLSNTVVYQAEVTGTSDKLLFAYHSGDLYAGEI